MSHETEIIITIFVVLLCVYIIVLGLWSLDIGASAMILNAQLKSNGIDSTIIAGNGWQFNDACQQYHVGMYLVIAGMLLLSLLCIVLCVNQRKKKTLNPDS